MTQIQLYNTNIEHKFHTERFWSLKTLDTVHHHHTPTVDNNNYVFLKEQYCGENFENEFKQQSEVSENILLASEVKFPYVFPETMWHDFEGLDGQDTLLAKPSEQKFNNCVQKCGSKKKVGAGEHTLKFILGNTPNHHS